MILRDIEALRNDLRAAFEIEGHTLALVSRTVVPEADYVREILGFETASGEMVRGLLTRPLNSDAPAPGILYIHAHGGRYEIGADELLNGRRALHGPLGPVLARAGYVSLCIDLPTFGARASATESALAKALLWRGKSLAGQMLGELHAALDYLNERTDVDEGRLGAFGISMGATLGYWLAAVDPRLGAVAHLCCYADFAALIATGSHDLHGIYLTIPGLLDLAGNGEIAGLIAPRAQWIGIGDKDPLTPPEAVDIAFAQTQAAYRAAGVAGKLVLHREAEGGHVESPKMRAEVLAFFATHLMNA